jgi:hypothetical protein
VGIDEVIGYKDHIHAITPEVWNILVSIINSTGEVPSWVKKQSRLKYEDVLLLPRLDHSLNGQDACPDVVEKNVAPDYLDFLREQIRADARGPEWLKLIQARLKALEPFVGKPVLTAMFFRKPDVTVLRIDPKTRALIQFESD